MKRYECTVSYAVNSVYVILGAALLMLELLLGQSDKYHVANYYFVCAICLLWCIAHCFPLRFSAGFVSLLICDQQISEVWYHRISTHKLRFDEAHVRSVCYRNRWYCVFSKSEIDDARLAHLWRIAYRKDAFLFPLDPRMVKDFPELFYADINNPYV